MIYQTTLNELMGAGRQVWTEFRTTVQKILSKDEGALANNAGLRAQALIPAAEVTMHLPARIGT